MKSVIKSSVFFLLPLQFCSARTISLDGSKDATRACLEMYGSDYWQNKFWSRSYRPEINVYVSGNGNVEDDPIVAAIIFHQNYGNLGGLILNSQKHYVCDHQAINASLCGPERYGGFIGRDWESPLPIMSRPVHLKQSPSPISYPVKLSGTYCVELGSLNTRQFKGLIYFENGYGELPAIQLGRLKLSSLMAILWTTAATIASCVWFQTPKKSNAYKLFAIFAIVFAFQNLMLWVNLTDTNWHGYKFQCVGLRRFTIILTATRNTSTFLLSSYSMLYYQSRRSLRQLHHFILAFTACVLFVLSAQKESELLRDRVISRDTDVLVWTLACSLFQLVFHGFLIWTIMSNAHNRKQTLTPSESRRTKILQLGLYGLLIFIIVFTTFDGAILLSWIKADDLGLDLLSRMWWSRWFVVDEWQTFVYVLDAFLTVYACS